LQGFFPADDTSHFSLLECRRTGAVSQKKACALVFIQNGRNLIHAESRAQESAPMTYSMKTDWRARKGDARPLRFTRIPVIDPNGDEVAVYEREIRCRMPVLGISRKLVTYELDTGDCVVALDDERFLLTATGEIFARVKQPSS
jgi:hypothetical protein